MHPQKRLCELLQTGPNDTIFSVLGKMDVLLDYFKHEHHYKSLVPFLETYYLVTKRVALKSLENAHFFNDVQEMDRIDIRFAELYFTPLLAFLDNHAMPKPWNTYFKHCLSPHSKPFVQMLLGINAHINADLPCALTELNYTNRKDFLAINKILEETIPTIMHYLAFQEHDLLGVSEIVFKQFMIEEFKTIIVRWRESAWKNAKKLKTTQDRQRLHALTEKAGKDLIKTFEDLWHLKHATKTLERLHEIEVSL